MDTNNTGNEIAVIYARFSSSRQQETSIEGQLAAAHQYADLKGYTVIREYCDRAKTGTNDNREAFQQMLSDCSKKQFTVIIVWKVDRFGRNREEITFNKYRAKKHGVRVEYVAENLGEGPEGVILESVLEGMAEYYSLQLSQNVSRGLLEAAKKHHVIGGRIAYGYRTASDKTYEIDPEEAPRVKAIFDMYANGSTESEIVAHLNSQGLLTRRGTPFNRSSLRLLLKNERYIGTYIYKDIFREENVIPPIVTKETFQKVQSMLKQNRRMPSHRWSYSDYLLTGKLFCGECGEAMVGKSGFSHTREKYSYYSCLKKVREKTCCKKNVRQDWLELFTLQWIHRILDDDLLNVITEKTWEYYLEEDKNQAEKMMLDSQLQDITRSLNNLMKTIEAGMFSSTIRDRMEELEQQKAMIEKALVEYELSRGVKLTKEHIYYFLLKFRDMDFEDRECQRRIIDVFVNRIVLWEDRMAIALNYTGEDNTLTVEDIKKTTAGFDCGRESWLFRPAGDISITWFRTHIILNIKIPGV